MSGTAQNNNWFQQTMVTGALAALAAIMGAHVGGVQARSAMDTQLAAQREQSVVERRRAAYEAFIAEAQPVSTLAGNVMWAEFRDVPHEELWRMRAEVKRRSDEASPKVLTVGLVGSAEAAAAARDFEMWAGSMTGMKLGVTDMKGEMDVELNRFLAAARRDLNGSDSSPIAGPFLRD